MNLNINQILSIILVVLSVLVGSTAQLTDLFGPLVTKDIVSIAMLFSATLNGILVVITGQASQLKAVQAMPGVDKIVVNKDANATLATLAIDPMQSKIEPAPEATAAITRTAVAAS